MRQLCKWNLPAGRIQCRHALYGPAGHESIIWRMESQELSIRNGISEELARSEFPSYGKRRLLCVVLSRSAVQSRSPRIQRQAGDAVNQAVREASEKYEEIHGIQTRNEGRMEENERRVAQGMGPKQEKLYVVREAICTGCFTGLF